MNTMSARMIRAIFHVARLARQRPRHSAAAFAAFAVFAVLTLRVVLPALAAPPTSPYAPGETLNPSCAPGDTNCTVRPPITGTTTSTEILFGNGSSSAISSPNLTFVTSTGAFSVTATSTFTGSLTVNGLAVLTGAASTTGFTFTNATGTTLTLSGAAALSSVTFTSATGTSATSTFGVNTGSISNLNFTNATGTNLNVSALTVTSCNGCGSVTTSSAITAGYFPYWANATGGLNGTSTLFYNAASSTIGIGTTQPSSTLHVAGTLTVNATSTVTGNILLNDDGTQRFIMSSVNGGVIRFSGGSSGGERSVALGQVDNNGSFIGQYLTATASGVAIGTVSDPTSPATMLEVANTTDSLLTISNTLNNSVTNKADLYFDLKNGSNALKKFARIGAISTDPTNLGGALAFYTASGGTEASAAGQERVRIDSSGNVGIGTAQPSSTLYIVTSTPMLSLASTLGSGSADPGKRFDLRSGGISAATGTFDIFDFGSSTSRLVIDRTGNVGIGTAQPSSTLHVIGALQVGTSTFYVSSTSNRVGIGTAQPSSTLHIVGDLTVTATSTFSGAAVLDNASLGAMTFDSDAGQVTWIDMPVTASSAAATVESYTAQIDGNPMFTLYSESDGAGGTVNRRIGIGTQYPSSSFHVFGNATSSLVSLDSTLGSGSANPGKRFDLRSGAISAATGTFDIFDSPSSTSRFTIDRVGNVGIGAVYPSSTLHLFSSTGTVLSVGTSLGLGSATPGKRFDLRSAGIAAATGTFDIYDFSSSTSRLVIDQTGWVGIGTAQPSSTLHIVGNQQLVGLLGIYTPQPSSTLHISTSSPVLSLASTLGVGSATPGKRYDLRSAGISAATGSFDIFDFGSSTTRFMITQVGRIGIGTSSPQYAFVLGSGTSTDQRDMLIAYGALCVDGGVSGNNCPASPTAGVVYASSTSISQIDLAENYPTLDESIEVGDVVAADPLNGEHIVKGTKDNASYLLGAISGAPGVLLGRGSTSTRAVGLAGRIPVKVTGENGAIHIGDFLTASSKPGYAMKQTDAGESIGVALQEFTPSSTQEGKIVFFIKPGFTMGALAEGGTLDLSTIPTPAPGPLDSFTAMIQRALYKMGLALHEGVARVKQLFANKVTTNELCVGSTCVDENQLRALLNNGGIAPAAAPAPAPAPAPTDASSTTPAGTTATASSTDAGSAPADAPSSTATTDTAPADTTVPPADTAAPADVAPAPAPTDTAPADAPAPEPAPALDASTATP